MATYDILWGSQRSLIVNNTNGYYISLQGFITITVYAADASCPVDQIMITGENASTPKIRVDALREIDGHAPAGSTGLIVRQIQSLVSNNGVPVYIANSPLAVSGTMSVVGVELTRPGTVPSPDTTPYAAKDAVSNSTSSPTVLTFASAARVAGGDGYITKVRIMSDNTNVATSSVVFKLHLFHTSPTAINDNAPYTLLYANAANRIGTVTFPAMSTEGSGSTASNALFTTPIAYKSGASTSIFGLLETDTAFTPASGQKFYIEITFDNN